MASPAAEGAVLRISFVEMLFALAAGQVGIHAAELVAMEGSARIAGVFHLILGLVVVAASWFGWQRSAVRSSRQEVERLFSMPFMGLLLDVGLVIIYFILIEQVDITKAPNDVAVISPSARPEALWLLVVFVVYVIWDVVTDVLSPGSIPALPTGRQRISVFLRAVIACTLCSTACALLSALVLLAARDNPTTWSVVLLDVALLAVVLLFRVLKPFLEPKGAALLGVSHLPALAITRTVDGKEGRWIACLLFFYCLALACAT